MAIGKLIVADISISLLMALSVFPWTFFTVRFLQLLKEINPDLDPQSILSDFELASESVQAVRSPFPNALVVGCFFHLGQAVWCKIQSRRLCFTV
jgi:hypothetical protein